MCTTGAFLPFVFETMEKCDLAALKSKPAMLISGDKDYGIAPDHAVSDFQGLFPTGEIVQVAGVGHFCQEDIPEELVQLPRVVHREDTPNARSV